jgi:NTE family protein
MPAPVTALPDVLVLGVGGTLGEAWLRGLLSGLESASDLDFRRCEHFVGSSAGSIVAAALAGGRRPEAGDRAAQAWAAAAPDPDPAPGLLGRAARGAGRLGAAAAGPLVPVALAGTAPAGRALRAAALRAVPEATRTLGGLGRHLDALGARFDGRLRVAAVDRRNGGRVMFGAPGAPQAEVSQAVLASCAVPGIFAPVRIGGREYVDGGVWSPTNLDAAPGGRGSSVLCLVPTALEGGLAPLRAFSLTAVAAETLAVRSRGAEVRTIVPDADSAAVMGANLMDRRRTEDVLDAAFAQGRALAGF